MIEGGGGRRRWPIRAQRYRSENPRLVSGTLLCSTGVSSTQHFSPERSTFAVLRSLSPPKLGHFSFFQTDVERFHPSFSSATIIGDFNIDLNRSSYGTDNLLDFCSRIIFSSSRITILTIPPRHILELTTASSTISLCSFYIISNLSLFFLCTT